MKNEFFEIDQRFKIDAEALAPIPDPKIWNQLELRLQAKQPKKHKWYMAVYIFALVLFVSSFVVLHDRTSPKISKIFYSKNSYLAKKDDTKKVESSFSPENRGVIPPGNINSGKVGTKKYIPSSPETSYNISIKRSIQSSFSKGKTKNNGFSRNEPYTSSDIINESSNSAEKITDQNHLLSKAIDIHQLDYFLNLLESRPSILIFEKINITIHNPTINVIHPIKNKKLNLKELSISAGLGNSFRKLKENDQPDLQNKTYYDQYERSGRTWNTAILLNFSKNRNWSLTTGLVFQSTSINSTQPLNAIYQSKLNSESIYTTSFNSNVITFDPKNSVGLADGDLLSFQVNANQTSNMISFPLLVNHTLFIHKLGIRFSCGIQTNFVASQDMSIVNSDLFFTNYKIVRAENNSQVFWSALGSIQVSYPVSKQYDWFAGLQYDSAITSANNNKTLNYLPIQKYLITGITKNF